MNRTIKLRKLAMITASIAISTIMCFIALGTSSFGQAVFGSHITSEAIGPLSGELLVSYGSTPTSPPCNTDSVSFTGNVHVVTDVDTSQNTMDVHINLMTVKGNGTNGRYVGNGATSLLSQPKPPNPNTILIQADLIPPGQCRAGFNSQGALPIAVTLTFAEDNTLAQVTAVVQVP
jgi:hypothetical protein